MRQKTIFLAVILMNLIISCKNNNKDNSDKVAKTVQSGTMLDHVNYYIRYEDDTKKLSAQASVTHGNVEESVKIPGGFVFSGTETSAMQETQALGIRYDDESSGDFPDSCAFMYKDAGKKEYTDYVKMSPVKEFSFKDKIHKRKGATLKLAGPFLSNTESLILVFTDAKGQTQETAISGPSIKDEIQISPNALTELSTGKATVYIVKKKFREYTEEGRHVISQIEFYSKSIPIEIAE